ncbi:uncharacterized protein BXZ73DRAFT_105764 [Epithele typhae]|uniref:uncharacterized protein n=1 Tax=Epithele typhae TaxID=378194 RepID=UPI002008D145|nr:uncharacterized protein BXZ73DRAFT_105764 [Epithele typhae]KAH9916569.1 hypothetical protein BXZ73DRAFT_105764 [Epithele typhae]
MVAENVEFQVYKGILMHHSPVFKKILSRASTPNFASSASFPIPEVLVELDVLSGLPIVTVQDAARDWRYALRALMGDTIASRVTVCEMPKITSEQVFAFIRLGHKYQMESLRRTGLDYLKHYFTSDFGCYLSCHVYTNGDLMRDRFGNHDAIGVANLARLTGELSLLPTALLLCCRLDLRDLREHGLLYSDGQKEVLNKEDWLHCCQAAPEIVRTVASTAWEIFKTLPGECEHVFEGIGCMAEISNLRDSVVPKLIESLTRTMDPFLGRVDKQDDWKDATENMAPRCRQRLSEALRRRREAVWEMLPSLFNIEIEDWGLVEPIV